MAEYKDHSQQLESGLEPTGDVSPTDHRSLSKDAEADPYGSTTTLDSKQLGVAQIEAISSNWTTVGLIVAYAS
jgi:hypothetical protein